MTYVSAGFLATLGVLSALILVATALVLIGAFLYALQETRKK